MPRIRIQLKNKNHACIGEPYSFVSDYVPRVGELVDMKHALDGEENTIFMVTSVVGVLASDGGIIPNIVARQWYKGLRAEILEEYGWLTQSPESLRSYDEDEFFD